MSRNLPVFTRLTAIAFLITISVAASAVAQTVTVNAPQTASTIVGHDAGVVVSATTSVEGSQPVLAHTAFPANMHIRQLTSGQTSTWQLSWTPRPGDSPSFVCFQASDAQQPQITSFGQTCTTWQIQPAPVIGVTGIVRTFAASHPDMSRPLNEAAAPAPNFVAATLGADSKPVFAGSAPGITRFNEWFNTVAGVNQESTYSVYLSNGFQFDPNVYAYSSANWQPVDTQQYFTYEAHTGFTYYPGQQLTFKSSDDMWIFVNGMLVPGANLHGVHAERTMTVVMDPLGLTPGASYPLDIFYAHRGATTIPSIQLQLGVEPPIPSVGPAVTAVPQGGFTSAVVNPLGAAQLDAGELRLLPPDSGTNDAAAGWLSSSFHLQNGFDLEFSYVGSPTSAGEGFAVVISSAPALGGAGSGLGYEGLPRSLAVEFDSQRSAISEPSHEHIAVHSMGLNANSSLSTATIGVQPYDPQLQNSFYNASPQHVRVAYTPVTTQPIGWLRVWMNDNLLPSIETLIPQVDFSALLDSGRGFLGFTAGRGTATSVLTIRSAQVTTLVNLPPYPFEALDFRFVEGRDTGWSITILDVENDQRDGWVTGALPAGVSVSPGTQGIPIQFHGAPAAGSRGNYPVTLHMTDGFNTVATPFVIVVNHPPVAVDDAITGVSPNWIEFQPLANDGDLDGDLLMILSIGPPQHGAIVDGPNGSKRYIPAAGFVGTDTFSYTMWDGFESATATVTATVTPVNDPPAVERRMQGQGRITASGIDYAFQFTIAENPIGSARGSLDLKVSPPRSGKKKESVDHFESTAVNAIVFADDPAFRSGKAKQAPLFDSAVFSGIGKWNGAAGYRFEAKATDQGEPGPGRDRFTITIYNASNVIIANVDAAIGNGNIQSSLIAEERE